MMEVDNRAVQYLLGLFGDPSDHVNIYLAHMLYANTQEDYKHTAQQFLNPNPSEFVRRMQEIKDPYVKYFMWKVNADHLLIFLTIWFDMGRESPPPYDRFEFRDPDAYMALCEDYYRVAGRLNYKIYMREHQVGTVLRAIGSNLGTYVTRLRVIRRAYLLFLNEYNDDEFGYFVEGLGV